MEYDKNDVKKDIIKRLNDTVQNYDGDHDFTIPVACIGMMADIISQAGLHDENISSLNVKVVSLRNALAHPHYIIPEIENKKISSVEFKGDRETTKVEISQDNIKYIANDLYEIFNKQES